MKVYVAGPMKGKPYHNFPLFHEVSNWLREQGFLVSNPADKETLEGTDRPDPDLIPEKFGGRSKTVGPGDIFREDFRQLIDCDGIVLLPGWHQSTGARAEALAAGLMDMPAYRAYKEMGEWQLEQVDGFDYHTITTIVGAKAYV